MTEKTIFECDVTGEHYGARNDVFEAEIRRQGNTPFELRTYTIHAGIDAMPDGVTQPFHVEYIAVKAGADGPRVVGICKRYYENDRREAIVEYHERESPMAETWESFFEWLESEVLH